MNYVEWAEFNELTNFILDNAVDDFIYYSNCFISHVNWNQNIKNEYYPGIYEEYPPIEYGWTKWKISEWLEKAWSILENQGLTYYTNSINKCEVLIIYLSLINLCFDCVADWREFFLDNHSQFTQYLDIKYDDFIEIIYKQNIDINFFSKTQNNKSIDTNILWILILSYQKKVAKVLGNHYGSQEKLHSAIIETLKPELDEDYIYYSLEEFFLDEYSFQRNETESLLSLDNYPNNHYIHHSNKEIESASKIIANLFNGTVFGFTTCYNNIDSQETLIMYEIHPDCPFSYRTIEILELIDIALLFDHYDGGIHSAEIYSFHKELRTKLEIPLDNLCQEILNKLPKYITDFFKEVDEICSENHGLGLREFKISPKLNLCPVNFAPISFLIGFKIQEDYSYRFNCSFFRDINIIATSNIPKLVRDFYLYIFEDTIIDKFCNDKKIDKSLSIEEVLKKSFDELVNFVVEGIYCFFPLALLVNYANPISEIEKHLQVWNPKYKLEKYVNETNIQYKTLNNWILTLKRKKQIILQGSPGTGKTFIAENIAKYLIGGTDGFYDIIQFHPAYTYEDFIQGIRPQTNNGNLEYNLVPGRFLEFCNKAETCNDNCILIIDEINRANLSSVFGELMYLLEYRDKEIYLAGSQHKFKIPNNVYIIGTMNTADRSIALVDFALRRRFAFITVKPNYEIIRKFHENNNMLQVDGLITVLERINKVIDDSNYSLGIAYFLLEDLASEIENIWRMEIEPYLEEYFYNSIEQVDEFRWDNIKDKIIA